MTSTAATSAPTTIQVSVTPFRHAEGCVAYLVVDTASKDAMVIDPRLDQVDELIAAAREAAATIRWVADTHTHADHLSGVQLLAERTQATARTPETLGEGEAFRLGETPVQALPTPGHTKDSRSLLVAGQLFTGDALFVGGAGRTDFPGGSTAELYESFRRYEGLPDETMVRPGHDYAGKPVSTIGEEKQSNQLLAERDLAALERRMDVTGAPPANMHDILAFNIRGPQTDKVTPVELDCLLRLDGAVELIDVRSPSEYSGDRIDGAKHIPGAELASRMGEIDVSRPVVVMCQTGIRTADAMRQLQERGVAARALVGGIHAWKGAGLSTSGTGRLSIERQTQLTIGTVVLVTTILGAFVNPWFLAVTAFFGGGLVFAGASGTCTLALLIGLLPWNRAAGGAAGNSACAVGGASSACAVGGTTDQPAT